MLLKGWAGWCGRCHKGHWRGAECTATKICSISPHLLSQTETPEMLAKRNEQRKKQGLKQVRGKESCAHFIQCFALPH